MSDIVNVHYAKTHLSRLLDEVAAGKEIMLAKAGKPCARLVPLIQDQGRRELVLLEGRLDDSFFEPLPPDELKRWYADK
ncbi:MAG: type II toxin-antitoxin system Phd/YefM family antitoxin [Gammaproteobacteria bacterium]|nr:type II toxin-antitoxin system Phd/YefM family antitoxin [Gammaproteobacteria bacterium]